LLTPNGDLKVEIFNVTGQLVQQLDLQTAAARNIVDISLNNLSRDANFKK
jgi:hypothetical protein